MKKVAYLTQDDIRELILEALEARASQQGIPMFVTFVTEHGGTLGALVDNMVERATEGKETERSLTTEVGRLSDTRMVEVTMQVLFREGAEGCVDELAEHILEILIDHRELGARNTKDFKVTLLELVPRVTAALLELEGLGKAEHVFEEEEEGEPEFWRARRAKVTLAQAQKETKDYVTGEVILQGAPCIWVPDLGITVTHPDDWPEELRKKLPLNSLDLAEFGRLPPKGPGKKPTSTASTAADILGSEGGVLDRGGALGEGVTGRKRRS